MEKSKFTEGISETATFKSEGWIQPTEPLKLETMSWKPDFITSEGVLVVIILPNVESDPGAIPHYLERRMREAFQKDLKITCVLTIVTLLYEPSFQLLDDIQATIVLKEEDEFHSPVPAMKALAEQDQIVSRELRINLFDKALTRCNADDLTTNQKGKYLENLIHFLLTQIEDFRVKRCNWNTATEELDCVVQIRNSASEYCWSSLGPLLIVEAKNRKEKSGQEVITKTHGILTHKRGMVKIAIVVSLSGFTQDAETQVIRFSGDELVIVLVDSKTLTKWVNAANYEEELNDLVLSAMLY